MNYIIHIDTHLGNVYTEHIMTVCLNTTGVLKGDKQNMLCGKKLLNIKTENNFKQHHTNVISNSK